MIMLLLKHSQLHKNYPIINDDSTCQAQQQDEYPQHNSRKEIKILFYYVICTVWSVVFRTPRFRLELFSQSPIVFSPRQDTTLD